jgi:hypothetical protein
LLCAILLWIVLSGIGVWLLSFPPATAIIGGLIGVFLHWLGEILHQLGHARAARRAGNPMTGIRLWWLLSASVYPPDEPPLPAEVHISRALGGPLASLVVSVVAGVVLLALSVAGVGGLAWWLALFFFLDNLLVFTLGALLPLGFNDGSTLLRWLPQRAK